MDFHCRDDRLGPAKLARTDHFPLPKNMQSDNALALGCSQASTDAIAGFHLAGEDHRRLLYVRSENSFGGAYPRHASCAALRSSPLLAQDISERGVFTASQLRELQHHALIFKHLTSGVNVPPELVFPIRASLVAGFAPAAHPYIASLGWGGSYPLLYGGSSTDTEPGRCRRTDGKKWRCSRDVVPDHKYCERHMHRGKHRAKKPALAAAAATAAPPAPGSTPPPNPNPNPNNAHSTSSAAPSSACAPTPAMLVSPTSSSLTNFQPLSMHQAAAASLQQQQQAGLLGMQARRLTAKEMGYLDAKYQHMSHGAGQETFFSVDGSCGQASAENSAAVSGLSVMSSSSHAGVAANNPLVGQPACGMQSKEAFIGGRDRFHCQPLRHFFDDWPVRARESSAASSQLANSMSANGAWPYEDTRTSSSSTTQLSISIPSSKLMQAQASSSSSSPRGSNSSGVKLGLSPAALKLSMSMQGSMGEDDPLQLGSQLIDINEGDHFDQGAHHEHEINCNMSSWIPIAWEPSPSQHHVAGGPLAEVLQSSTNSPRSLGCKHSGLNLMSDGWDHHENTASPHHHQHHHQHQHPAAAGKPILSNNVVSSSPVGVLQINATLASSSDNSTANSPSHALNTNDADERVKSHAA